MTPSLVAAIAGSFQLVIVPAKMPGDGRGVEVERVDALDVERDRDRRDVGGDLDEVRALDARVERAGRDLVDLECAVGAGERDGAGLEGLAAGARALAGRS